MNKFCTKCKTEKPIEEFYKDKKRKDGLRAWCKSCVREDNKVREPEYKEHRRLYRELNKEKMREHKKDYYSKNKKHILSQNREWRNSIIGRLASYKRNAEMRNHEWNLSDDEFKSFWQKDCFYCGDKIKTIGIDRVDSKKGYKINNVVPCCTKCNIMKSNSTKEEFLNKIKQIYELHKDELKP